MDNIKQLLQDNGLEYGSTDDSNSETGEEESTISAQKTDTKKDRQGRKPTRRPNPNVHNRNALLARENRRKKKAHLEAMEKELEEVRTANKQLKKMLKQQMKAVGQLQREKKYFQAVITNHKEIESLIKAMSVRMNVQQTSNAYSPMLNSPGQPLCLSPNIFQHLASVDNYSENGSFDRNPSTSEHSDNDFAPSSTFNDTLTDLDENFGANDLIQLTTVAHEHSYADLGQMPLPKTTDEDAGICLHISNT